MTRAGEAGTRSSTTKFARLWSLYGCKPLTFFSGVVLVFSFAPWDFYPLIFVALIPWLIQLARAKNLKEALIQGLWLNILHSFGSFYWVGYTLHQFAMLPWPVAILGLGLFSLICQPQFYLFAPIWWLFRVKPRPGPEDTGFRRAGKLLVSALAYAGLDYLLPKLFVDTLGHAFHVAPALIQVADLGGAWLLTFIAFAVNESGYELFRARRELPRDFRKNGSAVLAGVLLLVAAAAYGQLRLNWMRDYYARTEATARKVEVAVIQANIGDFDKVAAERGIRGAADQIVRQYLDMSTSAAAMTPPPDIIVWPETAYPSTFRTPQTTNELKRDQWVEEFVRSKKIPVVFGGYDRAGSKDFNSFFILTPGHEAAVGAGLDLQVYHKNILLLFGEYIPGMESIQWLKNMFPQVGNFGRGPGAEVLTVYQGGKNVPELRVSPVICYEALFPDYSIQAARRGSQMILNVTNDSWFGPWGEPFMHLSLTVFRTIETRLPQLRATNTGITALIHPRAGELAASTGLFRPEIMKLSLPLVESPWTLMKVLGDWFGRFALLVGLAPILVVLWRRRR